MPHNDDQRLERSIAAEGIYPKSFDEICNGAAHDLSEQAFLYVGALDEAPEKSKSCDEELRPRYNARGDVPRPPAEAARPAVQAVSSATLE